MPQPIPPDSQQRSKQTYRNIVGLCIIAGQALACALLYVPLYKWQIWLAFPIIILSIPSGFALASWIFRRKGLSEEKQSRSFFILPSANTTDLVAELRLKSSKYLAQLVIAFVYILSVLVIIKPKSSSLVQWAIPLGIALLAAILSATQWYLRQKRALIARADAEGLLGLGSSVRKRVRVPWQQIAQVVLVEDFDILGKCRSSWLHFEDTQGRVLVHVPQGSFRPEVEAHFLSVVAHYMDSP